MPNRERERPANLFGVCQTSAHHALHPTGWFEQRMPNLMQLLISDPQGKIPVKKRWRNL